MCGIAGIVKWGGRWKPGDEDHRAGMLRAIAHRGPDGLGEWVGPEGCVSLLHARLAIIDKAGGRQPMGNEDGRVQVVFNGEIYNHRELRAELIGAGHRFVSDHSDTEVLVHGWEEWGVRLPEKLLGMFAFAIWDCGAKTLFLARDRMGQKPLFYATLDDGIVFGSTIGSVLAWPEVPRRVPREQIGLYLQLGYIPPPMTIYRDVSQVMPGHFVRVRGEVVDGAAFWGNQKAERENQKGAGQLRAVLQRAVESQLEADVPVACFLSGGIDSTIVATLMQRALKARGGDAIQTISVGFKEAAFDETRYAEMVARQIGSRHTRLELDAGADPMGTLTLLMDRVLGQPFGDSSILPTHLLSAAARAVAPVALSGDGGDELFAGYDRYRAMQKLGVITRAALRLAVPFTRLAPARRHERLIRLIQAARGHGLAERYTGLVEIFPLPELVELMGRDVENWAPGPGDLGMADNPADYAMRRDQAEYLPGDVLWKVDSAAMAVALEVRSPLLDHHVVEFSRNIPIAQQFSHGRGKAMLRAACGDIVPDEIFDRRKQGFAVPIGEWFRGSLRSDLRDRLQSPGGFCGLHLNKPAVARLLAEHESRRRDHTHRLFALLMLEIWWAQAGARVT